MKNQASLSAMNSRRNVSDDPQTIRRRSSRLSAIDELFLNIPIDLILEIFSKLPLKSIARCRCVSKQWASVLRRPDFTELFFTKSLARPKLLFAREEESEVIIFSSPQPQNQNPDENLSTITADHHMSFTVEPLCDISSPVNGYVCISHERKLKRRKTPELVWVICNPSTRQSFTLPKMKMGKLTQMRSFLGYDPVEKQHKVLAVIQQQNGAVVHQVLTLRGTGNLTWRLIECSISHSFPGPTNICINGVLYYAAKASDGDYMIVSFDVISEKYCFVKAFRGVLLTPATLVNYNGKLASLMPQPGPYCITSFEMMVLEDPEKHEWSNHVFKLPTTCKDAVAGEALLMRGLTATNEIVLSPLRNSVSDPFHVYYYNVYKEAITRVEIQGLGALDTGSIVYTFMNHVENVKLM